MGSGFPLTDAEYRELVATSTEEEWNASCDRIKAARGGEYPSDWFPRMMVSGIVGQKSRLFAYQRREKE